jgi:acyl carrier protein
MTDPEILHLIRDSLAAVAPSRVADFKNIALETTIESLALDSIATMEMVGAIEDKIGATFPDEALAKVQKVGDLATLVRSSGS